MARKAAVITGEVQAQFCAMLAVGCTRRSAARLLGVAESTLRNALLRDAEFMRRVKGAEQKREIIPLRNLQAAGGKSWRAAAWYLERLNPDVYGRRKPREITPDDLAAVLDEFARVLVEGISQPEERQAVVDELAAVTERLRRVPEPWDENAAPQRHTGPRSALHWQSPSPPTREP